MGNPSKNQLIQKMKALNRYVGYWLTGMLYVEAILLMALGAQAQNLFLVSEDNGALYQVAPDGTLVPPNPYASNLGNACGVAVNSAGDAFVSVGANGYNNGSILEITPNGNVSAFVANITDPIHMAFDSSGNLCVGESYPFGNGDGPGAITKIAPNGTIVSSTSLPNPSGLAFDLSGNLFVANNYAGTITKIMANGTQSIFASGLDFPEGLAFNSAGDLFESDTYSGNIYEFTPQGRITFASGLNYPSMLAFNNAGILFVLDGNGNVDEFTPSGAESPFVSGLSGSDIAFETVPEPSMLGLLGVGLTTLVLRRRNLTALLTQISQMTPN
jgi:hypothetical protein